MRVDTSSKCSLSSTIHHHYAATDNDHGDVGGGEYGSEGEGEAEHYQYQAKGRGGIGVRVDTSSKCSLSFTIDTFTQLLKMTMETSEEVSVQQEED